MSYTVIRKVNSLDVIDAFESAKEQIAFFQERSQSFKAKFDEETDIEQAKHDYAMYQRYADHAHEWECCLSFLKGYLGIEEKDIEAAEQIKG